jgi:release factor glutamine methyltransferase
MTEMLTVLEIIKKTTDFFARKGIDSPRLNAELLIGHALGLKRMQLYLQFERPLSEAELETIRPLVRRRGLHEPVQYILGETEFHGVRLKVDSRVLIPRPETEQLVELAVASCDRPPGRILDLGTGSGAIAIALARAFPAATITATDIDPAALTLARENAEMNEMPARIQFVQSEWFSALPHETFELIISNPPYLSAGETAQAPVEVRNFEPVHALSAKDDGLADLRTIIETAPRFLSQDGVVVLETGCAQHAQLLELLASAGFTHRQSRQDLARRDRFLVAKI